MTGSERGWVLVRNTEAGSDDREHVEAVARHLGGDIEVRATDDADELDAALRDADPADGLLDVVVSHAVDPTERVAFGLALTRGTHVDREDVVVGRGREVVVGGAELAQNRDGEPEPASDAARHYRVEPGSWRVLAPR